MSKSCLLVCVFTIFAVLFVCSTAAPAPKLPNEPEPETLTSIEEQKLETTRTEIEGVLGNISIPWRDRGRLIDHILDGLPAALFARLPLPTQFCRLPDEILQHIKLIHADPTLTVREKRDRIRRLMENLTYEQRTMLEEEPFPDRPPAGFEDVLEPEVFDQLLAVFENETLTIAEKKTELDDIMRALPSETVDRLPLPILMRQLPEDIQSRIHATLYDFQRSWDERFRMTRKFVRSLPKKYRRLLRPTVNSLVFDPYARKYVAQKEVTPTTVSVNSEVPPVVAIVEDIKPKVLSSLGFVISPAVRRRAAGLLPFSS